MYHSLFPAYVTFPNFLLLNLFVEKLVQVISQSQRYYSLSNWGVKGKHENYRATK